MFTSMINVFLHHHNPFIRALLTGLPLVLVGALFLVFVPESSNPQLPGEPRQTTTSEPRPVENKAKLALWQQGPASFNYINSTPYHAGSGGHAIADAKLDTFPSGRAGDNDYLSISELVSGNFVFLVSENIAQASDHGLDDYDFTSVQAGEYFFLRNLEFINEHWLSNVPNALTIEQQARLIK